MNPRLKILLSAYACEPNKGSEPEVGWKWATTLSGLGHEVHVITRSNNKKNIEEFLIKNKISNLNFIYFDFPKWLLRVIKGKSNPHSYLYFLLWQLGIFFAVKPYIDKIKFDFIHHVTFVSFRYPSFLCLYKVPFIFGPVSGGQTIPKNLRKNLSLIDKIKELLRDLSNYYVKISPLMNLTFARSDKIYVTCKDTKNNVPFRYHYKTEVMLAIGLNELPNIKINNDIDKKNFDICFVGNLFSWKAPEVFIKTFNEIKKSNDDVFLTVAGEGPMKSSLKILAKNLKIEKSILWLGQIKRKEVFELFKKSDLLIFLSLRDSGGFVILEAMSYGLVVATLDLGGPGQMVNNDCGIVIGTTKKTENEIILELANSINNLIKNKVIFNNKKIKSIERVKNFNWKNKVLKIYNT
jgi:glycosyltransferase involved in cell wall biosynthesis